MRVEIHLAREGRVQRSRRYDLTEVLFQPRSAENLHHLAREFGKILIAAQAQVPARQFLLPAGIGELGGGLFVDLLDLAAQASLFEERGELFVERLVLRIAVDFVAVESQRVISALEFHQTRDVAVEHLLVLQLQRVVAREFFEQGLVDGLFVGHAPLAGERAGHGEGHAVMLERLRVCRQEFAA